MKYNVGDKVKIKSLDWYNANKDAEGSIRIGKQELFLKEMVHLLGGVYTIKHACNNSYKLEGDEENWYVADYMLEDEVRSGIPSESLINAEPDKYDYCEHNELSTVVSLIDEGWDFYHHDSTRCYLRREKTSPETVKLTPEVKDKVGDMVNHPPHYASGKIECIDAMVSAFGEKSVADYCLIAAFKYIWRTKNKNGVQDIEKAQWYLNKYKELL